MLKTIIGVNGSPRPKGNTGMLIAEALKGAQTKGAKTELIQLNKYSFTPCQGCHYCKLRTTQPKGQCSISDELSPILERIKNADALILGTPIYFGAETAYFRAFLERLLFPYLDYGLQKKGMTTFFHKTMKVGLIYTSNAGDEMFKKMNYDEVMKRAMWGTQIVLGPTEPLICADTLQLKDYSKYDMQMINVQHKLESRKVKFPKDLKRAFDLGQRLID